MPTTTAPLQRIEYQAGNAINWQKNNNQFTIQTDTDVLLQITVCSATLLRFRFAPEGYFENDFSYAIAPDYQIHHTEVHFAEVEGKYSLKTEALRCDIDKKNLHIAIFDANGQMICEDEKGFHWEDNLNFGGHIVKMSKKIQPDEYFYGLGDKPMSLNLRQKRLQLWGTDEYGFPKDRDPLYKNIPFYVGLHSHIAYGIFFDNTFQSFFDFGHERRTVTSFWAQGGEMNYYFAFGPSLTSVVEQYNHLTGKPEMPPLWALGFQQSKWSYAPDSKVVEIADTFRQKNIPCDVIHLDIDYMDGFRCFTWDSEKFPNPRQLTEKLAQKGFKTVVIIDPGIKIDKKYSVYKEGLANDYFCRRADGPYIRGKVWPGDCVFPDYTNPKVRHWWAGLFSGLIKNDGICGVWNDMNEPALFEVPNKTFPDDVRHQYDGHWCSHRKAHNVYGMQMARATYEGVKQFCYPRRPFVITRSGYSGVQRYAAAWTGDNIASWEHLWVANMQCQRLSISGYSFVGTDIGGFTERPTSELFIRWIQLGIFHAFCRVHSSGEHGDQEPWSFGEEATAIVRKFIGLRYQLLPYIYTTFWQHVRYGTPMLRPLAFVAQGDENTYYRMDEFCLGDHIMACPVLQAGVAERLMYLPKGKWYNYFTNEMAEGGKELHVATPLDQLPMFVRAGAVIPHYPVMQYVGERKVEQLTLHVYYKNGTENSVLYEDAGDGYEYMHGGYKVKTFILQGSTHQLQITQVEKGNFTADYTTYRLVVHGLPFQPTACRVDGKPVSLWRVGNAYEIATTDQFKQLEIL